MGGKAVPQGMVPHLPGDLHAPGRPLDRLLQAWFRNVVRPFNTGSWNNGPFFCRKNYCQPVSPAASGYYRTRGAGR